MDMPTNTIQFIAILAALVSMFVWTMKLILPFLLKKINERDETIQVMTREFRETINHKTTEWTAAMNRLAASQEKQVDAQKAQTEVFKQLIHERK